MKLDFTLLKSEIYLEGKYVDFGVLRTALTVARVTGDLDVELTAPNEDGECRASCPKCRKERSLALNINTNRFNCFNKGCFLKGGGVIDLVAKLLEVPAKEASHLLALAYGIQPYSPQTVCEPSQSQTVAVAPQSPTETVPPDKPDSTPPNIPQAVNRTEFEALREKVESLSVIVWSSLFDNGEIEADDPFFDDEDPVEERKTVFAG